MRDVRRRKSAGVEHDEFSDALRITRRIAEADRPAPIMHDEMHALHAKMREQRIHVADARLKRVGIVFGFLRESHADVVGHDTAGVRCDGPHKFAVIKRPRRVAMKHHDRFIGTGCAALVEVTHASAARRREGLRREGIERFEPVGNRYHSSASIRQLSPLPMPSSATFVPSPTAPASTALASVAGSATEPVLPRVSNVEKSFARSRPRAS